ncbi:MAG: NAD(+) synthase [Alphaproteobacteria bacterium]|nr:NAD(+) synthase [Alphaproteobacteria bacterium]
MARVTLNPSTAHVAVASVNQTVGDWSGNRDRLLAVIEAARARGVRLLGLPEMCITGYSMGDRLLRPGTLERSWTVLKELMPHSAGMVVCVGLPVAHRGVAHNAIAVLADGALVGLVAKEYLATGDVEYENRWFQPWPHGRVETFRPPGLPEVPMGALVFEAAGLGRFALEICEDGWKGIRPGSVYALAGAEVLLNPSASWFTLGKHRVRRGMVEQISREDHCAYAYCSLLGCDSTRLVFDGSVFIAEDGQIKEEGDRFVFSADHVLVDRVIDLSTLRLRRMEEGSWREQVLAFARGEYGPAPELVRVAGDFSTPRPAPARAPYWEPARDVSVDPSLDWLADKGLIPRRPAPSDLPHLELELAIAMGLRDYTGKSGIRALALALSGGRDSAMVAVLVQRMLRYDNPDLDEAGLAALAHARFKTAYMATENSGPVTRHAAAALAEELGAHHHVAEIQEAVDVHVKLAGGLVGAPLSWENPAHDIALQNVQARLRGSLIWMLANLHGALLLATSNKSEAAVGYTTMDGDTSGGIAPIADVPKSLVSLWLRWAQAFHGYDSLGHVNVQAPTAELRPPEEEQTDEGDLMPFFVLDQLMYAFVQEARSPVEMFQHLWPSLRDRYEGDALAFAAHIRRFVKMLCRAQWKRERFAISFRVTAFDLDPKTGFRFPPVQAPFTEELAELDDYVASLG